MNPSAHESGSDRAAPALHTPIFLHRGEASAVPTDLPTFYLLSRDGLFLCRNHPFFRSCVPAPDWPSELGTHEPSIELKYPRIPQALIECVVGFFDLIGQRLGSEAAVLLAWDPGARSIRPIVPVQRGLVGYDYGRRPFPMALEYDVPACPADWSLIGDIHSHVDMPAFASSMDKDDERHRPGLHIVIGRLYSEPPEFHCELTVDGHRFRVPALASVIEGYSARRLESVPKEWIDKVRTQSWRNASRST